MIYSSFIINCREYYPSTCRVKPFTCIKYVFNEDDRCLIDEFSDKATKMANNVNVHSANNSSRIRSFDFRYSNCLAGVISEYCWLHFLNYKKLTVKTTPFNGSADQIDLEVISNGKKIEVRSSFPRIGIPFALCHPTKEFDIIGPYSNSYKIGEIRKDYFVRALFHMDSPLALIDAVKNYSVICYLTGGANYQMMFDPQLSFSKDFQPEFDNFDSLTSYRVVPFHNALDSAQIFGLINNEK